MTDREKLVDLLETHCAVIGEENCKAAKGEKCTPKDCANCLADHLLANVVTVREPQKPLTVEALLGRTCDVLYVEERESTCWRYPLMLVCVTEDAFVLHGTCWHDMLQVPMREYGREYRFWAEKPTDEERRNAEWLK